MKIQEISKEELLSQLSVLQQRIAELEASQSTGFPLPLLQHSDLYSSASVFNEKDGSFSPIFNALPIAMTLIHFREGRFTAVNNSFLRLTGFSREELIGQTTLETQVWIKKENRLRLRDHLMKRHSIHNVETAFYNKIGLPITVLLSAELLELHQEQYILASIVDISGQKHLQESLKQHRNALRRRNVEIEQLTQVQQQLLEATPGLVFFFSSNGTYLSCHSANPDLLYLPRKDMVGKKVEDILPAKAAESIMSGIQAAIATDIPQEIHYQLEIHRITYFFQAKACKVNDHQALLMVQDVTELTRLRQDMLRMDQLKLVGELAATIGHEVRNPLTTVRGFLQMLGNKEDCQPFADYFHLMIDELDRANTIVSEFLSLARKRESNMQMENLNHIIEILAPLIQSDAVMGNKFLVLELAEIPDLLLDAKEIRQLILNLARNGLEAMERHGVLTIGTKQEDNKVTLYIKDEGAGIPPELVEKVGTPFFTTKENGTGLGLPVCYNIADRHRASINVDTSPKGTTFHIVFRLQEEA